MLNWSSSALKTWVVVGIGALVLALSAFFILSTNSAFAQDPVKVDLVYVPDEVVIEYDENNTGPVTTLTSADPDLEGARIEWNVTGLDSDDFQISNTGVLSFNSPPNFEGASDRAYDANADGVEDIMGVDSNTDDDVFDSGVDASDLDETTLGIDLNGDGDMLDTDVSTVNEIELGYDLDGDGTLEESISAISPIAPDYPRDEMGGDNEYVLMVVATEVRPGLSGHRAESTMTKVRVRVINAEERGEIDLQWRQPQVDELIEATLSDPDGNMVNTTWSWYTSVVQSPVPSFDAHWDQIPTSRAEGDTNRFTVHPTTPDINNTYNPTDDIEITAEDDSDVGRFLRVKAVYTDDHGASKTAYGVSEFPVRDVPDSNGSPDFDDGASAERTVAENVSGDIGDPVEATDRNTGDHLTYELRAYTTAIGDSGIPTEFVADDVDRAGDVSSFSIDRATGQISGALDHENGNDGEYVVIARVTDPSGDTDHIMVTITATDVDDPPVIMPMMTMDPDGTPNNEDDVTYGKAEHRVMEHVVIPNTSYGDFADNGYQATDDDGDLISWSFEGDDGDDFKPCGGGSSCMLRFKEAPDYEAPTDADGDNVYELMLVATSTSHRDSKPVTVIVENTSEAGKVQFSASQPHIDAALTAMLTDLDGARLDDGMQVPMTSTLDGYPGSRVPDGGVTILTWQWYKSRDEVPTDLDEPVSDANVLKPLTNPQVGEERHWDPIVGATAAVYTPKQADNGDHLRAVVTYMDPMSPPDDPNTAADERLMHRREAGALVINPRTVMAMTANAVRAAPGVEVTPMFPQSVYTRTIAENARVGDYVGDPVMAVDNDSVQSDITYQLSVDSGHPRYFEVDGYGQIKVKGDTSTGGRPPLDFEGRPNSFSLMIKATDAEAHTSQPAIVNIEVTNLNESPVFDQESRGPQFQLTKTVESYAENDDAEVVNFSAEDPEDANIRYSVMGGDFAAFNISSSGVLTFEKAPNYESKNMYMVTVRATEAMSTGRSKSSEVGLTVNIMDVDEPGMVRLSLLQPEGPDPDATTGPDNAGTVITATVTDPDTVAADGTRTAVGNITWTWYKSKHNNDPSESPANDAELNQDWEAGDGTLDSANAVTSSYTPGAGDVGQYLLARASYSDVDGAGAADRTAYARSYTTVRKSEDDDNSSPEFPNDNAQVAISVSEGLTTGSNVGNLVEVTSPPNRDTLTYDLLSFSEETVGTSATDTDDFPWDDEVYPEDERPEDDRYAGDVSFFSINRVTGQITLKQGLDHDTNQRRWDDENNDDVIDGTEAEASPGKYVVFVRAKNSSNVGPGTVNFNSRNDTAYVKVTITATNVNEAPMIGGMAELEVREKDSSKKTDHVDYYYGLGMVATVDGDGDTMVDDAPTDSKMYNVYTATDPEGNDPTLTLAGPDAGAFRPKEGPGGQGLAIEFRDAPDYEMPTDVDKDNVYHVMVMANDGDGNTRSKSVTIEVMPTTVEMDPDNMDPDTEETGKLTLMPAQPLLGSMVSASLVDSDGIMTAEDGTETITSWEWYWTPEDMNLMVDHDTNEDTPAVALVHLGLIDHDGDANTPSVSLANDPRGEHVVAYTGSDYVYNADDGVIDDSTGNVLVGKIAGATTDTYETKRRDVGRFLHVRATYRDGSNPEDDPATGSVDESTPGDLAADGDQSLIGKDRVVIKQADNAVAPEPATMNAPEFPSGLDRMLAEMTPRGGYVGAPVMAMDMDAERGLDTLTYKLNGADARYFELETHPMDDTMMTGQIKVKDGTAAYQFDAEGATTSYTVMLTVTDESGLEDSVMVTIMVGNVNEAPTMPEESFGLRISGSGTVSHPELAADLGAAVYRIAGAGGASVTWTLSGTDASAFTLGQDGVLSFNAMPNFEDPMDTGGDNGYQLMVMASAGGQTDRVNVTVNVVNEDEDGRATLWVGTVALTTPPQVGQELTGLVEDSDGNPGDTMPIAMYTKITNVDWQWSMSDMMEGTYTPIAGATDAAYMVTAADAEMYLKAEATYTDGEGSGKMEEVTTMMVGAEPTEPMETALSMYDAVENGGNGNGSIDRDEYQAAAEHYLRDTIEKETYQEIAELYLRS